MEMGNAAWPKTEDGTINWEVVFEDAETGLIPLISSAASPSALRDSALAVVKLLYARKDDPPEVERFTSELQSLIPDDTSDHFPPRLIDGVTAILRQVKDERIQKAEEHACHKELIKDGDKRDAGKHAKNAAGKKAAGDKAKENNWRVNPRIASGAAAAVAALCLIVYFAVSGEPEGKFAVSGEPEEKNRAVVLIDQMTAAIAGDVVKTHPSQGRLKVETTAGWVAVSAFGTHPDACLGAAWYFANRGKIIINGLMPRRISPHILKNLCGRNVDGATLTWVSKKNVQGGS